MTHYNLSPILKLLKPDATNSEEWKNKIVSFFGNENYDPQLLDEYYSLLINNLNFIEPLFECGYLADLYTGLFTFDNNYHVFRSSFNMAYYIERNRSSFLNKKILTMTTDAGIMNVQLKLCGLDLVNSIMAPSFNVLGSILICIGNNSPPYQMNRKHMEQVDVVFINNMFETSDMAHSIWNTMIDMKIEGKEVYFTTHFFTHIQKHMIASRFEPVEDPTLVYSKDAIADLRFGYNHRIYRMI
jgi:hypothetical protein